jgi:hypothetical protein
VILHSNWQKNNYSSIVISADACVNTTENLNWCASPEAINEYVEDNIFYLIVQDNQVDRNLYRKDVDGINILSDT